MRGVPAQLRPCMKCPSQHAGKDGLCRECRCKTWNPRQTKKYFFTEGQDAMIRTAWSTAKNRTQLTAAKTRLAQQFGMPRYMIGMRASYLGVAIDRRRPWTQKEREFIRRWAGEKSVRWIAKKLHRAHSATAAYMDRLKLSYRVTAGYTKQDLQQLLGVSNVTVERWLRADYIRLDADGRIPEVGKGGVLSLVRNHADEYSFKRADEAWLKGILFPSLGTIRIARKDEERLSA